MGLTNLEAENGQDVLQFVAAHALAAHDVVAHVILAHRAVGALGDFIRRQTQDRGAGNHRVLNPVGLTRFCFRHRLFLASKVTRAAAVPHVFSPAEGTLRPAFFLGSFENLVRLADDCVFAVTLVAVVAGRLWPEHGNADFVFAECLDLDRGRRDVFADALDLADVHRNVSPATGRIGSGFQPDNNILPGYRPVVKHYSGIIFRGQNGLS